MYAGTVTDLLKMPKIEADNLPGAEFAYRAAAKANCGLQLNWEALPTAVASR